MKTNLTPALIAGFFGLYFAPSAALAQGLANTPGLLSITFWEITTVTSPVTFAFNATELTTRLTSPLSQSNRDFGFLTNEPYDVFYSDANGTLNPIGECLTIEALYSNPLPSGGGLNIAAVQFNFSNGQVGFGGRICSSLGLGDNYVSGSEFLAVDGTNPLGGNLATFSRMGNTTSSVDGEPRLRITIGDIRLVPEPATLALVGLGLACLGSARRKNQST